jgi:hypothetical protein
MKWTKEDSRTARKSGWKICNFAFNKEGIAATDDGKYENDSDAREHVISLAFNGLVHFDEGDSYFEEIKLCQKAIRYLITNV